MGELYLNGRLYIGLIPGSVRKSDVLSKRARSRILMNLAIVGIAQVVTGRRKQVLRERLQAPKHYISDPGKRIPEINRPNPRTRERERDIDKYPQLLPYP